MPVVSTSALTGAGVDGAWQEVERFHAHLRADGGLDRLRAAQSVDWMWAEMRERLVESLRHDERVARRLVDLEGEVRTGRLSPTTAAHELLAAHGVADLDDDGADDDRPALDRPGGDRGDTGPTPPSDES